MLLLMDHLALRARNYEYLIRLFQEWEVGARLVEWEVGARLVRSRGGTDICFFCFLGLVSVCSADSWGMKWSSSEGEPRPPALLSPLPPPGSGVWFSQGQHGSLMSESSWVCTHAQVCLRGP